MNKPKTVEQNTTFDRIMRNPARKKNFEKGYKEFLISELLIALMQEDHISVRKLSKYANVSPKVIQDLRSGKKKNITIKSLFSILNTLGYRVFVKKGEKTIPLAYQEQPL